MEKEKVWDIYNEEYAANYNDTFLLEPYSKVSADQEVKIIKELINADTKWLDIACGTGYFLSQFPGVQRAGYDLSPAMLNEAQKVNPDALFFKQGDFRIDVPEWHNQWTLTSCMWGAYAYVDSLAEVETLVANMIKWTAPGGTVLIPTVDLEDLRLVNIPYEVPNPVYGGSVFVNSCVWTWVEEDTSKVHVQIGPQADHFVKLFQPYFETVEIVYYPPFQDGWSAKKSVIAKNKLSDPAPSHMGKVIKHPFPPNSYQALQGGYIGSTSNIPNSLLLAELFGRIKNGYIPKSILNRLLQKINRNWYIK